MLTMLGVIIGVASVIAMIALGSGARAAIDQQIQSQGTNVVYVSAGSFGRGPGTVRQGAGSVSTLTLEDAQAIAEQVPTVQRLSPMVRGRGVQVIAGNQNWNTSIEGGNEDYLEIRNWPLTSGANFTPRDVLVAEKVCLLGSTVVQNLYPDQDPVGQIIRVKNLPFRVVGVLAPKGQGQWGQDQDDLILAPYTTVQKKVLGITQHPADRWCPPRAPTPWSGPPPRSRASCASATASPTPRRTTSPCARWRRWRPPAWRWPAP